MYEICTHVNVCTYMHVNKKLYGSTVLWGYVLAIHVLHQNSVMSYVISLVSIWGHASPDPGEARRIQSRFLVGGLSSSGF